MSCAPGLWVHRQRCCLTAWLRHALSAGIVIAMVTGCQRPRDAGQIDAAGKDTVGGDEVRSTVLVAVASNFVATLEQLETAFEASGSYQLEMASGSSGKLYAQIVAGAPYDVFLSADVERPRLLEHDDLVVRRFRYAQGRLVLWSARASTAGGAVQAPAGSPTTAAEEVASDRASLVRRLTAPDLGRIALANPELAPYGAASEQTLAELGLLEVLRPQLVFGENIGQAHALVATGNAQLGFTALSYMQGYLAAASTEIQRTVHVWPVPAALHAPLVQEGVWLRRAAANVAAAAFVEFLGSERAKSVTRTAGYEVPF